MTLQRDGVKEKEKGTSDGIRVSIQQTQVAISDGQEVDIQSHYLEVILPFGQEDVRRRTGQLKINSHDLTVECINSMKSHRDRAMR